MREHRERARARDGAVIESGPQAALFVLLRPSAGGTSLPRDSENEAGAERMRSAELIERKQFRLARVVVRSPPDRINSDTKETRRGRNSRRLDDRAR